MPKGEKGSARPFLRGDIWYIRYRVPGESKERWESSKSTDKNVALRLLNQRRSEIDKRQITSSTATVSDLLDMFLADQRRHKRKAYKVTESYVRNHLKPAFGKIKADSLTSGHIDRFIDMKQRQEFANASINRYLAALRRAFTLGMEALPPIVSTVPKISELEENNVREGFLDHPDYVRLREELPDHQRLVLVIGYHLGMRRGEILALRWDQVDWNTNLIRLEKKQTKGNDARVAPLYGELRAWLDMAYAFRGECKFIISWKGQRVGDLKRAWAAARERAGVPALLIHDLRRTAIRNMIRAGIGEKQAMLISGHRTRSVFDRYNIIDERDIATAGQKMARYLDQLNEVGSTECSKSDSKPKTAFENTANRIIVQ